MSNKVKRLLGLLCMVPTIGCVCYVLGVILIKLYYYPALFWIFIMFFGCGITLAIGFNLLKENNNE